MGKLFVSYTRKIFHISFNSVIAVQFCLHTQPEQANQNCSHGLRLPWRNVFNVLNHYRMYAKFMIFLGLGLKCVPVGPILYSLQTEVWRSVGKNVEFLLRTRQSEVRGKLSSEDPFNLICRLLPSITRTVHLYTFRKPLSTVMSHTCLMSKQGSFIMEQRTGLQQVTHSERMRKRYLFSFGV